MKGSTQRRPVGRPGFTLVEMLVVIVIISILSSLVITGAIVAIRRAREFAITQEMTQLTLALEKYKNDIGEYPPDFSGVLSSNTNVQDAARDAVLRHLRKRYRNYRPANWDDFRNNMLIATGNQLDVNHLDPGSALVFWLGGLPAPGGSTTKLLPFSRNPANPFAPGGSREEPLYEFDETRLVLDTTPEPITGVNRNVLRYVPDHVDNPNGGVVPPFVYFRSVSGQYAPSVAQYYYHSGSGYCVPYAQNRDSTNNVLRWFNPKTFQIISTGLDGIYTTLDTTVVEANVTVQSDLNNINDPNRIRWLKVDEETDTQNLHRYEDDNLTNFAEGQLANEAD
ncbi:MAG: type II secretion system protein [Pirellulales bacterium]|nr:type II secretion system protein [Pirellulales bacterium]